MIAARPRQSGYIPNFTYYQLKSIFLGLSLRKLTGINTQWVFGMVVKKFERENLENNTILGSNFDFTDFGSQNFVEWDTANRNTKKRFNRPSKLGRKPLLG